MTSTKEPIIIKFDQLAEQTVEGITRLSGFVKATHFVALIDVLDLEANPRESKVGQVTEAIRESITNTPDEFPFKSKGVLLGASEFEHLDRNRVRVIFSSTDVEGILDGGHNTLAIGMHILSLVLGADPRLRKVRLWSDFRALWNESRAQVRAYRSEHAVDATESALAGPLDFFIPVELIVPSDPDDESTVAGFRTSLLDICAARNNNVQLRAEAKANHHGYFEELKELLPPDLASRVEWKPNDGGQIKVADIIALTWIPLALIQPPVVDGEGKQVEPPAPQGIYRSKGDCIARFERFMSSNEVTKETDDGFKRELIHAGVRSTFALAADFPRLHDRLCAEFPKVYNALGGKYGRITAVSKMNPANGKKKYAKFTGMPLDYNSPEGFILPLVYGLQGLIERRDDGTVAWKVDPDTFLDEHLPSVVKQFSLLLTPFQFDPQKVGKGAEAYTQALSAVENAVLRIQANQGT